MDGPVSRSRPGLPVLNPSLVLGAWCLVLGEVQRPGKELPAPCSWALTAPARRLHRHGLARLTLPPIRAVASCWQSILDGSSPYHCQLLNLPLLNASARDPPNSHRWPSRLSRLPLPRADLHLPSAPGCLPYSPRFVRPVPSCL
jgi:hypothetical protein